jgi:hypothetical protein
VTVGLLVAACGSSGHAPQTFHPAGSTTPTASAPASSAPGGPGGVVIPPFGANAHVKMTSYLPKDADTAQAVVAAKDFLLAVLYADYTGGKDHRWMGYVSGPKVRSGLAAQLAQPGVTTESFRGTMRFWHMSAIKTAAAPKASVEVTECVDSSHALNTSLSTGKVLPRSKQLSTDENFYSNSDVLIKDRNGQWRVISILPAIYYPRAPECKK